MTVNSRQYDFDTELSVDLGTAFVRAVEDTAAIVRSHTATTRQKKALS